MFLDTTALIRQMKVTYNGNGITFANFQDGLAINAAVWVAWIHNKYVPNIIKAAVMELSGTLPEEGRMFSVSKQNPNPQYRIDNETVLNALDRVDNSDKPLIVTPVCLFENVDVRLLQDLPNALDSKLLAANKDRLKQPFHGQLHGVNQTYFSIVDKKKVDYDIESEPTGPCYYTAVQNGVCWYNEICKFMIMPITSKRKDLMDTLASVKFKE